MLRAASRAGALARRLARAVAALMFAAVFLVFTLKVALRYAAGIQLAWADELCSILFVWIIFWANAFLVPDRQQIAFDLAFRALPPAWRRGAVILRNLVLGGLFLAALPATLGYILFLSRQRTPVLQLRLDLVYACFGCFLACAALRGIVAAARALRAHPAREHA